MRKNRFVSKERSLIAKEGVYKYSADQLGVVGGDKDIYNVYIPGDELKKAMPEFKNLAIIDQHKWIGNKNLTKQGITALGSVTDDIVFENGEVRAHLAMYDNPNNFKNKQLSLGYKVSYKQQVGEFKGQKYDFIASNMRDYDHLAVVDRARIGNEAVIMDQAEGGIVESFLSIDADFDNYSLTEDQKCVNNAGIDLKIGDQVMSEKKEVEVQVIDQELKGQILAMDSTLKSLKDQVAALEAKKEESVPEVEQADQEIVIKEALDKQKAEIDDLRTFKELSASAAGTFEADTMDEAVAFVADHLGVKKDKSFIEGFLAGKETVKKESKAMDSKKEVAVVPLSNTAF